ncbi:hypothetical protein AAG906_018598 [Vitis piasezkii]
MRLFLSLSVIRGQRKKAIGSPRNSRKVESFVQLAWVHHFITIQFKALSSLNMVIVRDIIFILLSLVLD